MTIIRHFIRTPLEQLPDAVLDQQGSAQNPRDLEDRPAEVEAVPCEGFVGPYEGIVRDHLFRCVAGLTVASILNDGSISGCLSIRSDYHQGNIHQDNFWDVWENGFKPYRDRKWMKTDECGKCKAWRYCQGGAMHLRGENGRMLSCNFLKLKNAK